MSPYWDELIGCSPSCKWWTFCGHWWYNRNICGSCQPTWLWSNCTDDICTFNCTLSVQASWNSSSQQIAQSLLSGQPRASVSSLSDNISPFTKLKGFSLTPESSVGSPIQVFILESLFRFLSPHRVIFGLTPVTRKRSLDATSHSVYCFSYRWFLLWVVMILTYPMEEWPDWFVSFQSSLFFYLFFENTIFENTWKLVLVKMSLNLQKEKSLIQWCSWGGWGEGGMLYYS